MNLFDLTNQPTGLILGEYAGTPLYSVEDNYTYQYNGNGVIQRTSSGVETIKYSTDLTSTEVNNIYQLTFDISLFEQPDTLGTEAKIEFQHGIDGDIGSTFFELSYDDLIQLNFGSPSTTFTAQYTTPISGQSILQIKSTEVGFYIQNIQVENLGEEDPGGELLIGEIGGSIQTANFRACLCDAVNSQGVSVADSTNGSFKDDFRIWYFTEGDYDYYRQDNGGLGFSDQLDYSDSEIPEMFYPSNCIGLNHADNLVQGRYSAITSDDYVIYHDAQLCIFGGAELNPEKQNLIGLTWRDFIDLDLFRIHTTNQGILEVETGEEYIPHADTGLIYYNKSGPSQNQDETISSKQQDNGNISEPTIEVVKYTYNFNNYNKTDSYLPRLGWWGKQYTFNNNDDYIWDADDETKDYSYKTFSDSFNPLEEYQPDNDGQTWAPSYTTSENIYPIWKDADGVDAEDLEDLIEFAPISTEVLTENFFKPIISSAEVVYPGKCPPQYQGEENQYGFGTQTLGGFGPVMCGKHHFSTFFQAWKTAVGDNIENPAVKMSSPVGTDYIDVNPDAADVKIPILANSPDNNTFNIIKEKFIEKYTGLDEPAYQRSVHIWISNPNDFSSVKVEFGVLGSGNIYEINLSAFAGSEYIPIPGNITATSLEDVVVNGDKFTEEWGRILFTPASTEFEKETTIKYQVDHYFADRSSNPDAHIAVLEEHLSGGNGNTIDDLNDINYDDYYNGNRIYNYGNGYETENISIDEDEWYNGHWIHMWGWAGPTGYGTIPGDDNFYNGDAGARRFQNPINDGAPYYPYKYWSWEWDEQSKKGPNKDIDNQYVNMVYWSSIFTYPFYSSFDSYWQYDDIPWGPELKEGSDVIVGQDIDFYTYVPWPEQIIGKWDSSVYHTTNPFGDFNGSYSGLPLTINIFITGTIQYSGDFGIPGFDVDLNPSLDSSYDPYSGIDLRPEIIDENICQHIEIMKIQNQGGDGLFYKIDIHPLIEDQPDEVQQITCDTNLNFKIDGFSMLRARCGDGSTILMADTGPGSNIDYTADYFYLSGINACKYASNHIRSYPNNKQFHFGANLDKRPSLGLFYYEEDNKASENFTGNLGEEFEQYPNTNLVQNSSGFLVDSYDTWFLDNNQDDSYHPQSWGIRYTDATSTQVAYYGAHHYEHLWDNYISESLIEVHHPRIASAMNNRGYNHNDYGGEDLDQFINHSSFDFNTRGYYRYTGYDSYFGSFYENTKPRYRGKNPRWIFEREDYVYSTNVQFYRVESSATIKITNDYIINNECPPEFREYLSCQGQGGAGDPGVGGDCGEQMDLIEVNYPEASGSGGSLTSFADARVEAEEVALSNTISEFNADNDGWWESDYDDFDGDPGCDIDISYNDVLNESYSHSADYDEGTHPRCHSNGTCLNFNANQTLLDETSDKPYKHLTQWQELLTSEQATQLFYHDEQSTPDLKVSFWMYTDSNKVDNVSNPTFPEVEISITKIYPYDTWLNYNKHSAKGHLNSLSNPDNIAGSGRFKNTVLDEWEKFEFSFNLYYGNFYDNETRKFSPLYLVAQYSGVEVLDINANTPEERYEVVKGNVYLDDFSVTETGTFIPDVDVRAKKGEGNYGVGSLMEYYDPMIEEPIYYDNDGLPITQLQAYNDTTAPLEAQFYFYPRFFNEQVFDREDTLQGRFGDNVDGSPASFRNELVANDFRRGRFYLYDVDFGDGSEKEFTDEPLRLGNNTAVFHTYTKAGIYEITGYMLRTRPSKNEDGTPNHDEPSGVLNNKKVTVRININEGLDEDFTYFGSDEGFSYIPYKNISPVVGGISEESSYYKAIKRQLGFIGNECRQVEFSLRSDQTPPGDDEFYLAQDYPYFDENVIPNFDGDLSNIGCDFNFYSIRGGGTPNHIKNVSFMRALCGDGTYALIGDADGKVMEMGAAADGDGNWTDFFHLTGNEACGGTKTSIYFEKESDKLKTEIALSKMDSSLNSQFEILPEFQIPRYSEPDGDDGKLIYGGITTNKEELGKSLGNVDLTNIRFFNEPKEIYQMFGFTCDNNLSDIDLIPLGKPDYGLNFSNHSSIFTNVDEDDIQSPYFTNVSKVANQYENGSIITDQNAIRFGHDFRIDDNEGLGSGQWNHIDGAFVDTPAFNTPDLGYNQTYTYSTHIYIPFGYCEDGRPCSAEDNQYTMKCSECNGIQQYDEVNDFNVRIVQNMWDDQIGLNDWVHDLWHADIVGEEFANTHQLPTSETPGDKTSFRYKQFDAFNHCHPKGVNNPRFKYGWDNGVDFPIRDGQYCSGLDYQRCGLTNSSGEADGCYWDGGENDGYCMAANLYESLDPVNRTCWQATSEEQCEDGCEWYDGGSNNSNYETAITILHDEIITDEWFRLDFPFTTGEPSEYGNHISLRFDTHLGKNRIELSYPEVSGDLVTNGTFDDPTDDISDEYLATLPSPGCFEEYDINGDEALNVSDRQIWFNPESDDAYGRLDVSTKITELILADDTVEAAGGHCPNGYDGIDYEIFRNPTIGNWVLLDWNLFGDVVYSNREVKINFGDSFVEVTQEHEYDSTTDGKIYKLKYKVIESTTEEDSKLLIVAREDGYVVGQSIELPTNTIGAQEVIFTSDNDTETEEDQDDPPRDDAGDNQEEDEGAGLSVFYERTLIIGHSGGYNDNDFVVIDDVELYEVGETEVHTTTPNEGLYTFGAQLLAGDFSGDNLINYTTEDLNPGDCVDFEGGNPSNPRYWKNIIPSTYPFNYREGISDESLLRGGSLWPTPAMPDASDVWTYDTEDIEVVYKQNEDKLINTVKVGASNGGDGEEIKTTINGLYDHIVEDCDDWDSCVSLMDVMDLSQWYELKFTYYGTEEDVGGETNSSLKGVGIRMKKGSRIKADDWDRNTQGPNDGTTIVTVPAGHTMDMWIYGDAGNDYQQEQHPDFWVQANCTVGEECTVWILLLSSYYATTTTSHEFQLLNGQLYDRTTWGNFSLTRADVALGIVEWEDLLRRDMDYSSEQEWIGTNEYGNTYYYPVLPRFGLNGTFESANNQFYPGGDYDYPNDNIPFPIDAVVTEENPQEQSMLINIYNEQDETNVFKDGSGNNNNAFVINDYKPKYNEETSEPQSIKNVDRIRTSKDEGAF